MFRNDRVVVRGGPVAASGCRDGERAAAEVVAVDPDVGFSA